MVELSYVDLLIAATLVLVLALMSIRLRSNISSQLVIAAIRTAVQLTHAPGTGSPRSPGACV